ncbi:unnamed protein product, partial [marine sediment metagenome]
DAMLVPVGKIETAADAVTGIIDDLEQLKIDMDIGVTDILSAGVTLASVVDETSEEMDVMVGKFAVSSDRLEMAATDVETAATGVEAVSKQFAPELLLPLSVKIGEPLNIKYSSFTGLTPIVKVATHDGQIVVSYMPMVENSDQPGLYEYLIAEIDGNVFAADKSMMITVSEPVTSNFEAGSVQVVSTSLETVAGLVAAGLGVRDKINKTFDAVNGMTGAFGEGSVVHEALTNIDISIE